MGIEKYSGENIRRWQPLTGRMLIVCFPGHLICTSFLSTRTTGAAQGLSLSCIGFLLFTLVFVDLDWDGQCSTPRPHSCVALPPFVA